AFPRLNAFSFWTFLFGGLLLNASWFVGGAPDAGWFGYANLTSATYSPGMRIDFWVLGLQVLGVSTLASGLNFATTILNMRAEGMSMMRLPLFSWMTLVTSFLIILAFPAITVGLFMLMFDRMFGAVFFDPAAGGSVLLWQHLFWIFGHPEVYILILPAMGIASEVIANGSRKPIFGYKSMVFAMVAISFLGFIVWGHHMFQSGMNPTLGTSFMISTLVIAVPSAIKTFNWMGTMWRGNIQLQTPNLFGIGFVMLFVIGGLSGIYMASTPVDVYIHDTYYI
ncbi:MAG: cbb3-type cytochrome c oxidase subunit I, partial [Gemmatimonadota bacterium]